MDNRLGEMDAGSRNHTENCLDCPVKSPLFRFLTVQELELVRDHKITVFFRKGETIRKQGTHLTHVLSLNSGFAKLFLEGNGNRTAILRIVKPTNFIGGPAIYVDQLHHFTVSALTDSRVCFIDLQVFKRLIEENLTFANELMKDFNRHILSVYTRLLNVTQKKVPGRMADTLLYLSTDIFEQTSFPMYLSKQDLADLSGMSRESALKILRDFQRENIIRMNGGFISLLNIPSLKNISRVG